MSDARPNLATSQTTQNAHLRLGLLGLLVVAALVRLPGIARPLLGDFATRSVANAMVARNWAEGRAGVFYPAVDCLVDGQRGLIMLEQAVSVHVAAWLWKQLGGSLDVWGRSIGVAFSAASVGLLFLFVRRRHGPAAALGAGGVLALAPVSVIHGQSFMLEPSLVFFTVAVFYCVERWSVAGRVGWLVTASICLALLLLTKIYMLVLLLPLGLTVLQAARAVPDRIQEWQLGRRTWAPLLLAIGLAVLPVAAWSIHALRTAAPGGPMAGHVYFSLQDSAEANGFPNPLLWTPDFYRQLVDDLTGVVLTPVGFMLLLAGFLDRAWRRYAAWLLAMAILVALLPRKFHEMNYYYVAVLPPLCIVAGLGWQVIHQRVRPGRGAVAGLLFVALVLSMRYAAKPAFVTPEEDRAVVAAGRAVGKLAAEDEPVATMHGTGISLLYYCDRPGWAVEPDTPEMDVVLEDCRRQGARYLVVTGPEATDSVPTALQTRTPIVDGDGFCIYPLGQ